MLSGALQRARVRTQILRTHPVPDVYATCPHCACAYTQGQLHGLTLVGLDLRSRVAQRVCRACKGVIAEQWS